MTMPDAPLSCSHEKVTMALSFGRIRTSLEVDHFSDFPIDFSTFFHVNLLLVQSHQAQIMIT